MATEVKRGVLLQADVVKVEGVELVDSMTDVKQGDAVGDVDVAESFSPCQWTRAWACSLHTKAINYWTMLTNRKKPEEELDETLFSTLRYRPEELETLEQSTKFTRKEIQL